MSLSRTLLLMVLIGGLAASAIQREYYSPTYSLNLRWVSHTESK